MNYWIAIILCNIIIKLIADGVISFSVYEFKILQYFVDSTPDITNLDQ